jgi:hypothetical protein
MRTMRDMSVEETRCSSTALVRITGSTNAFRSCQTSSYRQYTSDETSWGFPFWVACIMTAVGLLEGKNLRGPLN